MRASRLFAIAAVKVENELEKYATVRKHSAFDLRRIADSVIDRVFSGYSAQRQEARPIIEAYLAVKVSEFYSESVLEHA